MRHRLLAASSVAALIFSPHVSLANSPNGGFDFVAIAICDQAKKTVKFHVLQNARGYDPAELEGSLGASLLDDGLIDAANMHRRCLVMLSTEANRFRVRKHWIRGGKIDLEKQGGVRVVAFLREVGIDDRTIEQLDEGVTGGDIK